MRCGWKIHLIWLWCLCVCLPCFDEKMCYRRIAWFLWMGPWQIHRTWRKTGYQRSFWCVRNIWKQSKKKHNKKQSKCHKKLRTKEDWKKSIAENIKLDCNIIKFDNFEPKKSNFLKIALFARRGKVTVKRYTIIMNLHSLINKRANWEWKQNHFY